MSTSDREHSDGLLQEEGRTAPAREAVKRPLSELERYAGWLAKDHASVTVRADAQALVAAIDVGAETSPLLLTLEKDIDRLPSGGLRKMLRKAAAEIRSALGPPVGIDGYEGEGS